MHTTGPAAQAGPHFLGSGDDFGQVEFEEDDVQLHVSNGEWSHSPLM